MEKKTEKKYNNYGGAENGSRNGKRSLGAKPQGQRNDAHNGSRSGSRGGNRTENGNGGYNRSGDRYGHYDRFDRNDRSARNRADVKTDEEIGTEQTYMADEALPNEGSGAIHGDMENGAVIGRNAVRELLKSGRPIDKLLVRRGDREGSIVVLVAEAVERGIPVVEVDKNKLDQIAGFAPHQGVVALAAEKEYATVEDILKIAADRGEAPLIVIADGITDPYNLGALIRCAEGAGAHGLIIPKRRASGLTPLVTKASAGAIEHLAIAKVANLASTVQMLQKEGVWVFAAEAGGTKYYETDFRGPCALVFGSEGNGVSAILKQKCDGITSIPMYGQVNSLNVSTAAAVILAEAARQHREPTP